PGFTTGAKRTHWQAAVARQEVSGLSAAAFCREQGLSYQSFISWRKRFATEGRGDAGPSQSNLPGFLLSFSSLSWRVSKCRSTPYLTRFAQ
ncbi:MAG: hypothetical protein RLY93_13280, partial [Sumerlaeia bacterium]